ncbi:CRISPR-associated protein Cas5 [Actinoalloteichus spitiensis]|uniref:CRISPR-associated protein Cas5 n=1 Tax=Actinoalloteichus spitiensis TaxID=252394 RepID=UPI00036F29CA|nr:CRISPR-associated protein Cas5 [Actinoalloteichus spitiensis]
MSVPALEVTFDASVASFRNPLYPGLQVGLPCPPPSTVGGLLAAAAGGWGQVPRDTRFALCCHAEGRGTDLETFHPLAEGVRQPSPVPKDRDYLWGVRLTVWLFEDLDRWYRRFRRPVWPLRLGRSQDLCSARAAWVDLWEQPGRQGTALLVDRQDAVGTRLRLTTAISVDRARMRWDDYRHSSDAAAARGVLSDGWSTHDGQAVVPLPPTHPEVVEARS